MFHTADAKDIIEGKITDVYFERTLKILKAKKINPVVKAEFIAKSLPDEWQWAVLAGMEEVSYLLKNLPVKARALREGTVFNPYEPVMEIEGRYQDFCVFETALLGLMCQASGVATKATRFKRLAGERPVISFGARRMHPVLAPMIERNAYIGGCDGVAVVKSGEVIGEDPMGTMPHALIICMGSTVEAIRAYDEVLEPKFKRVALIDTFLDEKFEALNVADAMGDKLFAIRLDTPSSRRGDFYRILEEVRWELDLRGYENIKLFVSGGIKEHDLPVLNEFVDAYGIGTSISNAPVVDFSMDIMEVEGNPLAKRGKCSGGKRVLRCKKCNSPLIVPNNNKKHKCRCGGAFNDILNPFISNGKILQKPLPAREIRSFVLKQTGKLEI
ncbi:MAG TPA: nicotinate phosphoribosyltransferase [Nitrospirae bacterium]|nr:nicotinate phosphoribosyltransferase pncB2 [bacterium BMS3Abin06]GBD98100.1 nicotinate phosphoribosyltransferase pncB2 [bacterium BMS3Abin07]GBE32146.1 nicotinate phosphoribosyltransferase pncB2 [bacterium BMS3Bbin05]HDH11356.1 nicotinate phosphoribosyltransferase [Nitrospirota bacterium]HDZ03379.1 nicotinate phosphoribosyltransferase [Nitrospirota bacterium]